MYSLCVFCFKPDPPSGFFLSFSSSALRKLLEHLIIFFSRRCAESEAHSLDLSRPMARQLPAYFVGQSERVNHGN